MQVGRLVSIGLDGEDGASNTSSIRLAERAQPIDTEASAAEFARAAAALFEEARQRTRRRHRRVAIGGLAIALAAAGLTFAVVTDEPGGPSPTWPTPPRLLGPERVLARKPYLGVSCRRANSIACDRVGLAVWTRERARAVRASIAGRSFVLTDDRAFVGPHRPGEPWMFVGFLHHAGLRHGPLAVRVENGRNRWTGKHPAHTRLRLVITFSDRSQVTTSLKVPLEPGWG